jgi:branched-subunit amino acid ABC-type transport system permease component
VFSLDALLQLTVNGLLNGAVYALVGWSFALLLHVTGRFHLAYAFTFALAAMLAAQTGALWNGVPWAGVIVIGAVVAGLVGAGIERLIYQPIAARAGDSLLLAIFVAALGIQIVGVNLLSLIWVGKSTLQIRGFRDSGVVIGELVFSMSSLVTALVCIGLLIAAGLALRFSRMGRVVRAVAANPEMSRAVGIDPKRVFVAVFAVCSAVGGAAAVLTATSTAASPGMGAKPLFFAFVVAFVARGTSVVATAATGIALGLIESWTALFVPPVWSSVVVFALLLVYVAARPYSSRAFIARLRRRRLEVTDGVPR